MSKLKFVFTALLVLLIIATALLFPTSQKSPVDDLEELTVKVTFEGQIELKESSPDHRVNWLVVKTLNYPEENDWQDVIEVGSSESYSIKVDKWGNHYMELNFSDPKIGINKYKVWSIVKVRKQRPDQLVSGTIDLIPKEYMTASDFVQSNTSVIKSAADAITAESTSTKGKIIDITNWVNEYLTYDLLLENVTKDAVWVLENQVGVCVEYSHLELALLRSKGIPARHVYGVAPYYFPSGWQEHTWVEAFAGAWFPVDPTWGETDFVDASHVRFAAVPDQSYIEEHASVSGINLEMGAMLQPTLSVEILEIKEKEKSYMEKLLDL